MFADTHCHLKSCGDRGLDISAILAELDEKKCPFLLDIGTEPDDLRKRYEYYCSLGDVPDFLFFSAGIWPSTEAIEAWEEQTKMLRTEIRAFLLEEEGRLAQPGRQPLQRRFVAVGECGLDRYWNKEPTAGEFSLFEAQLELAKEMNLPAIIHSRDGFDETLSCLKNSGVPKAVIHCFSYGKKEAAAFLDQGWYISLAGTITYAKKDAREAVAELVRYIPRDRLLLETDAPYLTPVPFRGKVNSPTLVEHTYRFAAEILGLLPEELSSIVAGNAQDCFLSPMNCS
jgi:TatD DNase family protein